MPHGTLRDHLHGSSILWIGTWRLKIFLQSASALEHLHNEVKPPIVHRDAKLAKRYCRSFSAISYFEFEALNIGYWVWLQDGLELGDKVHFVNLSRVNNVQLEVRRLVGSLLDQDSRE
ncbi:hypothetical protein GH714_008865 [Hevea brasiliensis]|uniref:Protein kinase domain-containing protein n=1 Tax=Hevea brasiliensis TaxID=3981 RepID=A0A6A6MXB6_HEVBR|nr:hypothetical protein GH714_008865 [Hevea brasiliensis]